MAFKIKQNDTSPSLQATLKDSNLDPIDLTGASVQLHMKSLDGTLKIDKAMTVVTPLAGLIQYDWDDEDTDTVGTYYIEFEVTYADSSVETFPNNGNKSISIVKALN